MRNIIRIVAENKLCKLFKKQFPQRSTITYNSQFNLDVNFNVINFIEWKIIIAHRSLIERIYRLCKPIAFNRTCSRFDIRSSATCGNDCRWTTDSELSVISAGANCRTLFFSIEIFKTNQSEYCLSNPKLYLSQPLLKHSMRYKKKYTRNIIFNILRIFKLRIRYGFSISLESFICISDY